MTVELKVPFDLDAEEAVAGCCIDSHRGYLLAASRLVAEDLYHPALRRLFVACSELARLDDPSLGTLSKRIEAAAGIANVPEIEVARIVDDRPVQRDQAGGFAYRVRRNSELRRQMSAASDLYNAIGLRDMWAVEVALERLKRVAA